MDHAIMKGLTIERVKADIHRTETWLKQYSRHERQYKAMGEIEASNAAAFQAKQQEITLLLLFDELAERCKGE